MIFCIPVSESKGLDSRFEPDFSRAAAMVIYNADTKEALEVPLQADSKGARIPAHFDTVLCGTVERGIWQEYLHQGVRFFGMGASTAREAVEKYRNGNVSAVNVVQGNMHGQKEAAAAGCGCGRHGHGQGMGHRQKPAEHVCCGGKGHGHGHGHGMGSCGGHGKGHGGCGCG